ncbi:MAG TPA: hypothetical protein VIO64_13735 [Pseudobacteroides sp.]|uniref:hypothetical protein n=1 Tax=Pseudobacteroides sp. TaxID=1968840 RepID=UPI002F9480DB
MKIKNILLFKISGATLLGIFLIIWGPLVLCLDYNYNYLDYIYVDYPTYFEYFRSSTILLASLLCTPMILGTFLIISKKTSWVRNIFIALCIALLIVSSFILMVKHTGFGPGFGDMKYAKKHLDESNSKRISIAITMLIAESDCKDLNDLYDSLNENHLNIRQREPDSVKLLIEALQEEIYYKSVSFGPYLEKSLDGRSGYEAWKPRSTKNAVGYRIEIFGDNVKCFPVLNESEAVIIIK